MTDEELLEEMKKTIREGRELLKDFKQVRKEVRELIDGRIQENLNKQVKQEVDRLGAATKKAMDDSVKRVFSRFDTLADLLMGEDDPKKPSLTELVEEKRRLERY